MEVFNWVVGTIHKEDGIFQASSCNYKTQMKIKIYHMLYNLLSGESFLVSIIEWVKGKSGYIQK